MNKALVVNMPEEEMVGDLPASLIQSILGHSGYQDSQAVDTPVDDPITPGAEAEALDEVVTEPPGVEEGTTPVEGAIPGDLDLPPVPPGGPLFSDDPDFAVPPQPQIVKLSDGTELTMAQVEALIHRQPPQPSPTYPYPSTPPTPPLPPAPLTPTLPPFTEDDLENPAVRAVVLIAAAQQKELADIKERQAALAQQNQEARYRENAEIVNSAVAAFKQQYNLSDELMALIEPKAGQLVPYEWELLRSQGKFSPYEAVTNSLVNAYWMTRETRSFEFERQSATRQQAIARQRKLNGVGGSGGSAPRTAPAPDLSTPEGRHAAAVAEVAAAMGITEGNE